MTEKLFTRTLRINQPTNITQYTEIFQGCKNGNFSVKNIIFFLFLLQTLIVGTCKNRLSEAVLKPVSHQLCSSRAPICDDKFLGFLQQPQGVVYYTARLPYEKQSRKAAATSKTKLSTCSFPLRFVCVFWRTQGSCKARTAATGLLQGMQGVRMTDVVVSHPHICLTKAARLPQDDHAFIARLPYNLPLCLAAVFHILQDHLATCM